MMAATRIKPNGPYRTRQSVWETRGMRADTDLCEAETRRTAPTDPDPEETLTERMGLDVLSPEVTPTGRRQTEQCGRGSLRTERTTGTYDGPSEQGETEPKGGEETDLPLLEADRTGIVDLNPEVPHASLPQSDSPLDDSYNVPSDLLTEEQANDIFIRQ
ncbi:hypothetical protein DYB37_008883 [Aphanomyces astaci]|uniref:Uncharacterized protein n=1 Tax=Aphanomyces astaci TaxID=112090 RepID=A0A418E5U1_APHAT|nr:hypothetical protein DYB35_008196 [Aphanomyces astaci]RHZ06687.1 hypothetical protein DYB37_008883 [Aphanomyces astaci]